MRVATIIRVALLAAMCLLVWYLGRRGVHPLVLLAVVLVAGASIGVWAVNFAFKQVLSNPATLKGAALEGAGIILHSVEVAAPPTADGPAATGTPKARHWYYVELTIVPLPDASVPVMVAGEAAKPHFRFWDPQELILVPTANDGGAPRATDAAGQGEAVCEVREIEVHRGKGYRLLDRELRGSQRLRLHIGVIPGCKHLQMQYYLARFGEIPLPPHTGTVA